MIIGRFSYASNETKLNLLKLLPSIDLKLLIKRTLCSTILKYLSISIVFSGELSFPIHIFSDIQNFRADQLNLRYPRNINTYIFSGGVFMWKFAL